MLNTIALPSTPEALLAPGADALDMAFMSHKLKIAERRIAEQEKKIRELEDLAATDPLTGLMNRRGFEKFFDQELARTRRFNTPGSILLLLDLDKFKPINDTYGHQAGDACLKKLAEYLSSRLRSVDGAARLGGDEFAVLLSNTCPAKVALEIKAALNDLSIEWLGETIHFSASVGTYHVSADDDYASSYKAADKQLYNDKHLKNRFF